MLRLTRDDAVAELSPELGGCILRFAVGDLEVLRRAPPEPKGPLDAGSFALVPFANRVAFATFTAEGRTVGLTRNFGDHPHALHGHGWQKPWTVGSMSADYAVLAYRHRADDWPWDYRAEQTIALGPDSLTMTLSLFNAGSRAMPASLGFHPYFPRDADSVLEAEVAGVWLGDATQIPTGTAPANHFLDLAAGARLAGAPFVDNCHFGWRGRAVIRQRKAEIVLSASPALSFLHVYAPVGADFFCAEPVSAMPDALNRAAPSSGLRSIAPGESFSVTATIAVRHR